MYSYRRFTLPPDQNVWQVWMKSTNRIADDAMDSTKYGLQMMQSENGDYKPAVRPRKSLYII